MMHTLAFVSISLTIAIFLLLNLAPQHDRIDPIIDCQLRQYIYQYATTRVHDISDHHHMHAYGIDQTGLEYGHQSIYQAAQLDTICGIQRHTIPIPVESIVTMDDDDDDDDDDVDDHVRGNAIHTFIREMSKEVQSRGWHVESLYIRPKDDSAPSSSYSYESSYTSGRTRDHALNDIEDIQYLIHKIRKRQPQTLFIIYLLPGSYVLSSPLIFTAADSDTVYVAADGPVQITTATRITSSWSLYDVQQNIWRTPCAPCADIVKQKQSQPLPGKSPYAAKITQFEFYVDGVVQTLARWPNLGNRMSIYPQGYAHNAEKWIPPGARKPEYEPLNMIVETPHRKGTSTQGGLSTHHEMLIGGSDAGDQFIDGVQRGVPRSHDMGTTSPRGFIYDPQHFTPKVYANGGKGARVHAFHDLYWGNWQWEVSHINYTSHTVHFGWGGMQQNQGRNAANNYFIENVLEELDMENEWYYDEQTQYLYYKPNGTASLNPNTTDHDIWISGDENIISITGTSRYPVTNLHFIGMTFTHTHPTYLSSYIVPSGGDWTLHPHGAIYIEGCVECSFQHSLFHNLGGNAIYISGYNRNTTIAYNEFVGIGESAIASVGITHGIDGTQGQHPMGNHIAHNLAHEFGIYGKQAAFYFQAITAYTLLDSNVIFNGPRAGICFNDGFGGGHQITHNVLFNLVRETADHGAFNSWDRDAYVTRFRDGHHPSLLPALSYIHHNLIMSNYDSVWPLDHDDGSSWYVDTYNVLIYGGYKNLWGHHQITSHNLYIHPDALVVPRTPNGFKSPVCAASGFAKINDSGHEQLFTNNTCIMRSIVAYAFTSCRKRNIDDPPNPITHGNKIYTPMGIALVTCGDPYLTLDIAKGKENNLIHSVLHGMKILNPFSLVPFSIWQYILRQDTASIVESSKSLSADDIIQKVGEILSEKPSHSFTCANHTEYTLHLDSVSTPSLNLCNINSYRRCVPASGVNIRLFSSSDT